MHSAIAVLRTELAACDIDNAAVAEPRALPQLATEVDKVCIWRRAASFHKLGEYLPGALSELRAAVHRATGADRNRALVMLCELYYSAHSLAHKLGYSDLAALAVDRIAWAAAEADNPLWEATAQFQRAALLTSGGDWTAALSFLERCRGDIEPRLSVGRRDDLIAWGGACTCNPAWPRHGLAAVAWRTSISARLEPPPSDLGTTVTGSSASVRRTSAYGRSRSQSKRWTVRRRSTAPTLWYSPPTHRRSVQVITTSTCRVPTYFTVIVVVHSTRCSLRS